MKTFLTLCLTTVLLLANRPTTRASDQDFVIVNKTGVEIHALHVSPSDKEEWGPDILGKDTLGNGESAEIKFTPEARGTFDIGCDMKEGSRLHRDLGMKGQLVVE